MQGARHYATEPPKGGSSTAIYVGLAAAAGFGGYYYLSQTGQNLKGSSATTSSEPVKASPAFTGGDQGWLDLKLDKVDEINHNTKRFRFLLPDPDNVSGLHIACTSPMEHSAACNPTCQPD